MCYLSIRTNLITWVEILYDHSIYVRGLFKKYREFWLRIFEFFWRYIGTHIPHLCRQVRHFECSVNFWQLFCLDVFWHVFDFYIFQRMVQRLCITFCVKNKMKCVDAFRILTVACGEATLDQSNVYRWYKMFPEGREDVNDKERAGSQSTSTTDKNIDEVINRWITVRKVAEDLNISIGSCDSIFINNLSMRWVATKFVPKLLNFD